MYPEQILISLRRLIRWAHMSKGKFSDFMAHILLINLIPLILIRIFFLLCCTKWYKVQCIAFNVIRGMNWCAEKQTAQFFKTYDVVT